MRPSGVPIGIIGCAPAERNGLDRFLASDRVAIAGCADADLKAARALADRASTRNGPSGEPVLGVGDHRELVGEAAPDALAIFTARSHCRVTMDALQAGCHVLIGDPSWTNLQETTDIVRLAAARSLLVGFGCRLRPRPSTTEARRRLAARSIGPIRLITAQSTRPPSATRAEARDPGDPDMPYAGAGVVMDGELIDVLLWTSGQAACEIAAFQARPSEGFDLATAAAIQLADGTPATLVSSGVSADSQVTLEYRGAAGPLHVTLGAVSEQRSDVPPRPIPLLDSVETIEDKFVAAVAGLEPLRCPAKEALESVHATARSPLTGQVVRLVDIHREGRNRAFATRAVGVAGFASKSTS
jgi:predicted dehydrogenase